MLAKVRRTVSDRRYARIAVVSLLAAVVLGAGYVADAAAPAPVPTSAPVAESSSAPVIPITPTSAPTPTPTPTPPTPASISIDWVGDMAFGTPTSPVPGGPEALLAGIPGAALQSDVTLGNLETVLGDGVPLTKCAPKEKDCYQFEAPGSTAQMLKDAGFAGVNTANNHTDDAGVAGQDSTNAALTAAGLTWAGRPGQISYLQRSGVTIALLGFAPYYFDDNVLDIPAAQEQVREAKAHADIVIVMTHIGAEGDAMTHVRAGEEYYLGEDRGDPIGFDHAVIDAGADLVVGSGPHVLRGMEWYKGRLIAYSLGDFCGYGNLPVDSVTSISGILHVTLDATGAFVSGGVTPVVLVDAGTPQPDPSSAATGMMNQLSADDFGDSGALLDANGNLTTPQRYRPAATAQNSDGAEQ